MCDYQLFVFFISKESGKIIFIHRIHYLIYGITLEPMFAKTTQFGFDSLRGRDHCLYYPLSIWFVINYHQKKPTNSRVAIEIRLNFYHLQMWSFMMNLFLFFWCKGNFFSFGSFLVIALSASLFVGFTLNLGWFHISVYLQLPKP